MAGRSGSPEKKFFRKGKIRSLQSGNTQCEDRKEPARRAGASRHRKQRSARWQPAGGTIKQEGRWKKQTGGFDQEPYDQTVTEQRNDQML